MIDGFFDPCNLYVVGGTDTSRLNISSGEYVRAINEQIYWTWKIIKKIQVQSNTSK